MGSKDYDLTNPCWGRFLSMSERAKSRPMGRTEVVLCNNIENSLAERCLKRMGLNYVRLGMGIRKWNNIMKAELLYDYLELSRPEQVLYLDSTDVVPVGDMSSCDTALDEAGCGMLFSAETRFYPQCPSLSGVERFERSTSPNEYFALNAGCFLARGDFLRGVLPDFFAVDIERHLEENKGALEPIRVSGSDQFRWHILYKTHHPLITLDHYCRIFQTAYLHKASDFGFKIF